MMKKKKLIFSKRVLPILLTLAMLVGMVPFTGVSSAAAESTLL